MEPSRKPAQQTNIIDDLDAIAIAQLGQRKGLSKKKKPLSGEFKLAGTQNTGSSRSKPTSKKNAEKHAGPRYYIGDGLKISLYEKGGKRRPHARLFKSLRNKSTDYLLDIVQEYAGAEKRKEFKIADKSKAEIAEWIEAKETLALGPHPKSNLTLAKVIFKTDNESSLLTVAEPEQVDAKGKGKAIAPIQEQVKRKRDNATEPAQTPLQTKKLKTRHSDKRLAEQLHEGSPRTDTKATNASRKVRPHKLVEEEKEPEELPIVSAESIENGMEQTHQAEKLQKFMCDIGMHPGNPHTSTMVVRLPEWSEDRILTAITNTKTGQTILHDTSISRVRCDILLPSAQTHGKPFLKVGRHGRGGDFENDRDRQTGRGHEVSLEDYTGYDEYMKYRGQVYRKYPRYPQVSKGDTIHTEVKKSWNENELWYIHFKKTYPGFSVSHLWPCGCEKPKFGSEDDESEQE